LNNACFNLWKMVEGMAGHILPDRDEDAISKLNEIFDHWKGLIPQLHLQEYVYRTAFYGTRQLRSAPVKSRTQRIRVSEQVPSISFKLIEKKVFYELHLQISINGKVLEDFDNRTSFFIIHEETFFLLGSVRDAGVSEWMSRSGGWITIFKEHYEKFDREVLTQIRRYYKVVVPSLKRVK